MAVINTVPISGELVIDSFSIDGVQIIPPPDGFIRSANPDTGNPERMAVWLPPGATAESLGLTTFIPADKIKDRA